MVDITRDWQHLAEDANVEYETVVASGFIEALKFFSEEFNDLSTRNGFWEDYPETPAQQALADCGKIALMHSELSEALESLRKGDPPDDKIPDFKGSEAEFADCIIRILEFAHQKKLRVVEAVLVKHRYNQTRKYKHGKNC